MPIMFVLIGVIFGAALFVFFMKTDDDKGGEMAQGQDMAKAHFPARDTLVQADPAPQMAAADSPMPQESGGLFDRDKFLMCQKHLSISEKYYVYDEENRPLIFVERASGLGKGCLIAILLMLIWLGGMIKAVIHIGSLQDVGAPVGLLGWWYFLGMVVLSVVVVVGLAPLRHTKFFTDDSKSKLLLEVTQDKKFQFPTARYTLKDSEGNVIARFRRNTFACIFRKRWDCCSDDGSLLCRAMEDSIILSLARRLLGPLFGALRTNFVFVSAQDGIPIGEFNRKFTLRDRYVLDMSKDVTKSFDRRAAMALGVLLDTGENR